MEMVLELLSEGRKIIVFSQFTSMLALIRIRLDAERIRYSVLTGERPWIAKAPSKHFRAAPPMFF